MGEPCPECGLYIYKLGGCKHMVCSCGFEFCWYCLGPYKAYVHTEKRLCPLRQSIFVFLYSLMALIIYLKFSFAIPLLWSIQKGIVYYILAFILIHVYLLSFPLHLILIYIWSQLSAKN
mmetsp:Transcript_14594/g.14220  ORF Transcript_14594/g.14220 Transcript_14594/m.14220 type:complete len:119 (+) Transcript_14594:504-860(+)